MLIGLTGTFGCGKSLVATILDEMGTAIIDADAIAHEVVAVGSEALEEIRRTFGGEMLLPSGELNRKRMAEVVFASDEKRRVLNAIIHPRVVHEMDLRVEVIQRKDPYRIIILNVPLLFEAGLAHKVNQTVVVTITPEERMRRVRKRDGLSEEEVNRRLEAQWPQEEKVALADAVIDNAGSIVETRRQTRRLCRRWYEMINETLKKRKRT
jgi:dephospho-CoA kinase